MAAAIDAIAVSEEMLCAIRADDKARLLLGREYAGKTFRVSRNASGELLLTALGLVPERDMRMFKNPDALDAAQNGLADATAGRVTQDEDYSVVAGEEVGDD